MSNSGEPQVIEKVYTYLRNGKEITVRRRWTKSNKTSPKHAAVKSYFDNNMDNIRLAKNIRAVYNDFATQNPEAKCSYSTVYAYYQSVFNTRKARTTHERPLMGLNSLASEARTEAQAGSEDETE